MGVHVTCVRVYMLRISALDKFNHFVTQLCCACDFHVSMISYKLFLNQRACVFTYFYIAHHVMYVTHVGWDMNIAYTISAWMYTCQVWLQKWYKHIFLVFYLVFSRLCSELGSFHLHFTHGKVLIWKRFSLREFPFSFSRNNICVFCTMQCVPCAPHTKRTPHTTRNERCKIEERRNEKRK
jgi:hypothetical protein